MPFKVAVKKLTFEIFRIWGIIYLLHTGRLSYCTFFYCAFVFGEGNCIPLSKREGRGGEGKGGKGREGEGRGF